MPINANLTPAYFAGLLGAEVVSVEPIDGGGNSQAFKLTVADRSRFVAKAYPGPTGDGRDRLEVESNALKFMRQRGIECVPQPIAADSGNHCAIFKYIEGSKITSHDVGEGDIDQATRFLTRLDDLKNDPDSWQLPSAAEACFSVQAIIDNLGSRLILLGGTGAAEFLTSEFVPAFRQTVTWCEERISNAGASIDGKLALKGRTLSPSDFGFHNAIRRDNGELVFLDFEYFGWDDPAKMVSDFLLHPGMDLSPCLKARFVENMADSSPALMERLEIVFPLFGLKWCLILLNAFLPQYRQQRGLIESELTGLLEQQLEKARLMLSTVTRENGRFPYPDEEYTANVT
jgi:hypothetical protein